MCIYFTVSYQVLQNFVVSILGIQYKQQFQHISYFEKTKKFEFVQVNNNDKLTIECMYMLPLPRIGR